MTLEVDSAVASRLDIIKDEVKLKIYKIQRGERGLLLTFVEVYSNVKF